MIIRTIPKAKTTKLVAAYARVSTLVDSQDESYDTQVKYYTDYISLAEDWSLVKVYSDRGITGTSADKRPGFQEMIRDAMAGKINIILCKSISRFSRNYEDAQKYTHQLKSVGVEVRFEKEKLSTFDPQTDMILGTMMAVAQQESKSHSGNIRWSLKRIGEQGIRHVGNKHVLGYDEVKGIMKPNKEKWIIELIFKRYAEGKSITEIISELTEKGAKTLRKGGNFTFSNVGSLLRNEIFVGDRLIEKTPSRNYLTKKYEQDPNRKAYYVRNHHEAIISREIWEIVQARLKHEQELKAAGLKPRKDSHPYYGRIICGCCGMPYRRMVRRDRSGKPIPVWRCQGRFKGTCFGRNILESELHFLNETTGKIRVNEISFESIPE